MCPIFIDGVYYYHDRRKVKNNNDAKYNIVCKIK